MAAIDPVRKPTSGVILDRILLGWDATAAMCRAVLEGNADALSKALAAGAPATADDQGFPEAWQVFRRKQKRSTILHEAASFASPRARNPDDDRIVRQLITAGARLDATDHAGNTPLHNAAYANACAAARALVQSGADQNARNHAGQSPLHVAAFHSGMEVIDVLLAVGADPLAKDRQGRTPDEFAAHLGKLLPAGKLAAAAARASVRRAAQARVRAPSVRTDR